jgi:hypothetical protein
VYEYDNEFRSLSVAHERNIRQVDIHGHTYILYRMMLINLVFTLAFFIQNICANEPVIVHTQYGDVLGYRTDLARIFYSIPFAQPPIGTLRSF